MSKLSEEIKKFSFLPYRLHVVPEACTDGSLTFVASNPELPGCMSHGDTVEQAIQHLQEARELYVADLLEKGQAVPMPSAAGTAITSSVESVIWNQVTADELATSQLGIAQTNIPEEISSFEKLVA